MYNERPSYFRNVQRGDMWSKNKNLCV